MDSNFELIVNDLIEGTKFEINKESQVLTSSQLKVKTPIEVINCLLGGGIPMCGIYHTWGPPKGGKSTWLYQTMGNFQKQYENGISVVIDQESSADPNRLLSLGVNTSKVLRLPTTSIESGFLSLFKILENKKSNKRIKDLPIFIIWDTISRGLAQDNSTQSRMNAQDRARIIKNYLPDLSARIENQPFILGLINQVIYEQDRYGNSHSKAGGGIALQHDNHMSVYIDYRGTDYDSTGSFVTAKWSTMSIDKSKISPEVNNIPFKIDVTKGGFIVERQSFIGYCLEVLHYIQDAGRGWFTLDPIVKMYDGQLIGEYLSTINKRYHYADLINMFNNNDLAYDIMKYSFMEYISNNFSLQKNIIENYKNEVYSNISNKLEGKEVDSEELKNSDENINSSDSTEEVKI